MRPRVGLAATPVALLLVVSPARASEQCGNSALRLEDLNMLARDVALADRVEAHSYTLRDKTFPIASAVSTTASGDNGWQAGFGLPGLHEYPGAAIEYKGELVVSGLLRTGEQTPAKGHEHM